MNLQQLHGLQKVRELRLLSEFSQLSRAELDPRLVPDKIGFFEELEMIFLEI